ncbi:MAG TPA: regulatory protein RecX [Gemmatimonadaceae bacterium]|nr:regulatory protein RecX [Gemmatimonadaceae bacterium]
MGDKTADQAAFDKALEAIALRARSVKELERWLAQREHAPEHIAAAVQRLISLDLLNDAEYARSFARSRTLGRGMSRRRVQAELARRGIAREVADVAIGDVMADEAVDEQALVEAAAAKKMRALVELEPEVQRRRLYGFLARQGFPGDLVRATVAKLTRGGC